MTDPAQAPKQMLHVRVGSPDPENCPICKAHAPLLERPGIPGLEAEGIQIEVLHLSEILRCPCPLCRQAREDALG